jgi:hypothetical protein
METGWRVGVPESMDDTAAPAVGTSALFALRWPWSDVLQSWLNDGDCLASGKCCVEKDLESGGGNGPINQVINEIVAILLDSIVVNLLHLRPMKGRRKPLKKLL